MTLSANGWVGVGTAAPEAQLHVNSSGIGSLRLSGDRAVMGFLDAAAPAGQRQYQWRSERGLFRMSLVNDTDGAAVLGDILVANSSGQVGVGTASPAFLLDVQGGRVGIGTSSPGATLGVNAGSDAAMAIKATGGIDATGTITAGNIVATYQDVAEWVPSVQKLSAGTVVVLDTRNSNHVLASATAYDTRVAGVVSARPGIALGEAGEGKALIATTGRVKVKVDATRAPVRIGDLLVTSDAEGVAMRSEPVSIGGRQFHAPGTIIGKALEPLEGGTGEILVLLSLQ